MAIEIIKGDARHLDMICDASIDLIVTSPPFWAQRSYTDGGEHYAGQVGAELTPAAYIDSLIECTREWVRVVKPSGSLWVNLGDKYNSAASGQNLRDVAGRDRRGRKRYPGKRGATVVAIRPKSLIGLPWRYALRCIDDLGLILRAEIIWEKSNVRPESATDRVQRSHETWLHLTKEPRYFAAVDSIREPHIRIHGGTLNPLGKLPGSVWTIATQSLKVPAELGVDHFAAFPMEWPRRIILGWSPEGGTVLDPFGGTGTTALVADVLGRHGISVDMSADYCRVAEWRTTDPRQRARAARGPARRATS